MEQKKHTMPLEIKIEAADKGNEIKRLMSWPEEYCHAKPIRTDF